MVGDGEVVRGNFASDILEWTSFWGVDSKAFFKMAVICGNFLDFTMWASDGYGWAKVRVGGCVFCYKKCATNFANDCS